MKISYRPHTPMNNQGPTLETTARTIWETPPVSDQPSITLVRWSVMETDTGERHFVGFNIEDREGRVSTAIRSFDPATACGVTMSGRIYRLIGPTGYDPDGEWVWALWAYSQKQRWRDVSTEFQTEHAPADDAEFCTNFFVEALTSSTQS